MLRSYQVKTRVPHKCLSMAQGEWLRQRNEQQIMRNQSSLAGGLAGTRGLTDVAMLARSTTQVRLSGSRAA